MPLLGTPMLSRMVSSSSGGTISRIAVSTWSAMRAVCSMRVPVGARRCSRICPASTDGKKSCPRNGNSRQDSAQKPRNTTAKVLREASAADSVMVYARRTCSNFWSKPR